MNALKALITRYQLASLVVLTLLLAVVLPDRKSTRLNSSHYAF